MGWIRDPGSGKTYSGSPVKGYLGYVLNPTGSSMSHSTTENFSSPLTNLVKFATDQLISFANPKLFHPNLYPEIVNSY
jgi:hypothetical protein